MRLHQQGRSLTVETPAKLNLFLELLGRRADGYHELETLLISIGLYDTLVFTHTDSDRIELVSGSGATGIPADLPVDERNLIVRAAQLLCQHTGTNHGVHITLHKRIPVEAGMGGGSSDAAAALVGLNRLWQLGLPTSELHILAASLGSDVNFFLESPVAAIGSGRGEQITPVEVRGALSFVIVKPPSGCSTAAVFRHVQIPSSPRRIEPLCAALASGRTQEVGRVLHNGLQEPVVNLNMDVARTLRVLQQQDVLAAGMTGSGSACYGLCRSARHAKAVAKRLSHQQLGQVFSATSLT